MEPVEDVVHLLRSIHGSLETLAGSLQAAHAAKIDDHENRIRTIERVVVKIEALPEYINAHDGRIRKLEELRAQILALTVLGSIVGGAVAAAVAKIIFGPH